MVRTLDAALTSTLNRVTRMPALTLTIENHVLHYASYQSPGTADAWNDVCLASDNSIIRVQVTRGGSGFVSNFQVQRITDPSIAAQWSTWTTLPGSAVLIFQDGGCTVSNSGGMLRAFAQQGTGGNALWNWYSSDNGQTWNDPGVVVTPPGGALIKGIGSAGNNDQRANHIIVSGKPPTGGQAGALTTAEVYDDTHLHLVGVERILHHVDPKLTSTTQCAQKASFLLLQEVRLQAMYTVSVPLNPALQLLDGITLTDSAAPTGSGRNTLCRIVHVLAHYDAQHGLDDMQLQLEGM